MNIWKKHKRLMAEFDELVLTMPLILTPYKVSFYDIESKEIRSESYRWEKSRLEFVTNGIVVYSHWSFDVRSIEVIQDSEIKAEI